MGPDFTAEANILKEIRVGVIGLGFGIQHIRQFEGCRDVQVLGICGSTREKVNGVAEKYPVPHLFTDYSEMLKLADLDAVSIATPVHLHHRMALDALRAGKHVLCEKPLAMNVQEAKQMYEKARETGLTNMTNFSIRFSPQLFHLKELVDSDYLGSLYHIEAKWMEGYADVLPFTWRHRKAEGGFGALGDLGVHMIDMVRWIAGDFRRVCAHSTRFVKEKRDTKSGKLVPTELDDSCMFLAELEHDSQALFHVSRCAYLNNYISLEIFGEKGTLLFKMLELSGDVPVPRRKAVLMGAKKGDENIKEISTPEHLQNVPSSFESFIDATRNHRSVSPSFFEGLKAQEVVDAVSLSTHKNEWVRV